MKTRGLSQRARGLIENSPFPEYLQEHFVRVGSSYDPEHNSNGYIPLCIAENRLLVERFIERLQTCNRPPERVLGYDSMVGALEFREILSDFLGKRVFGRRPSPEHLAVLAGAGSVLELLFHQLADPGEGVLVPTPSYAGFWLDLETRNELEIVPVHTTSDEDFRLTPDHLDRAMAASDLTIRALLLTSPNNPFGTVYTREEIETILEWSRNAGLHVVFDEVYALSVFGDRKFTSCAELCRELGDSVHVIWAFSKDFGASGLRCGVLWSENEELLHALDILAEWACCSGHTQFLLGEVLSDEIWVDDYLQSNRRLLANSYQQVTEALDRESIPYRPAEAGFFLICDLRYYLAEPTWEAERALWRRILDESQVSLTPGSACRCAEPGFFRLCFAGVPSEAVVTGIQRLASVLARSRS